MRYIKFIIVALIILCHVQLQAQGKAFTRAEINQYIESTLFETNKVFDWNEHESVYTYSALLLGDSIATIGYQPIGFDNIKRKMHLIDTGTSDWVSARQKIISRIVQLTQEKYGSTYDQKYLLPYGSERNKPSIQIRVFDQEIIDEIKSMEEIRYFEPMGYDFVEPEVKSTSGCSNYYSPVNAADYTSITPQSRQSWHQIESNIDSAWLNSNKGEGIWIGLMDTGVSDTQEKLNTEFTEGDSGGRNIEKYGYYSPTSGGPPDGWQDQCGHGTAMAGLAAAPRGFNDTPAGVAYKSNLISYRVTEDVVTNTSQENDGLSTGIDSAAADMRVDIISISLGNVFSNSTVEDAIVNANNQGKLIFAAAGTSFNYTSWYGVIFPANLQETVAITGVKDAANRERCDACHDGSEVDFVSVMERDADNTRHGITLAEANHEQGYVGGSSCATATHAGIAALIWANNPTWDKGQVLNRMIQTSDNYPNRDSDFGWGLIDVNAAVDSTFSLPCGDNISNDVTMEITDISFPSTFDAFTSEAEWVIELNGDKYFFEVDVNGGSGNPGSFINTNICGTVPVTVDLGTTSCGSNALDLNVTSFEDDGAFSDCDYDTGDDDLGTTIESISFANSSFTHTSSAGDFIFTYALSCTPTVTPSASIGPDTLLCNGGPDVEMVLFAGGATPPYTVDYTINSGAVQSITTNGLDTILQSTSSTGTFVYDLIQILDANGCSQSLSSQATVVINPAPSVSISDSGPACPGDIIYFTSSPSGYSLYEFFVDANNNGLIDSLEILQSSTSELYQADSLSNGDIIGVKITDASNCMVTAFTTIVIAPTDYSTGGNGALTGVVNGVADYETDGVIDSYQIIDNGAQVDYDSGTEVNLEPGFEVKAGANFCALIDGCNGGAGGLNVAESEEEEKK